MVEAEAGGLVGALNGVGIAEYEAKSHAEKVGEGKTLVVVKVEDSKGDRVQALLQRHRAVSVEQRAAS